MDQLNKRLKQHFSSGGHLWLFLDYDGTLADFAPDPDTIIQDQDLILLLERFARYTDKVRIVILSGRRLKHIQSLLPVQGILMAGTYGVEYQTWEGDRVELLKAEDARPLLDRVKSQWQGLVEGQQGFYVEDKGYAVALHGKDAAEDACRRVMEQAERFASEALNSSTFHVQGGHKFLEVAPTMADKGQSIAMLLDRFPWPNVELIYIGDDDKDEPAFQTIQEAGGTAVLVSKKDRKSHAILRLENPQAVRDWLVSLSEILENL